MGDSRQEELLDFLHKIRSRLEAVEEMVHFHMSGDFRNKALRELSLLKEQAAQGVSTCLSCSGKNADSKE